MRFQSTLPAGGATGYSASGKQATSAFQSTLPAGGATTTLPRIEYYKIEISIHAPRGGSDIPIYSPGFFIAISIHAPRVGSDHGYVLGLACVRTISIHAPRGGSDSKDYQKLAENLCRVP